jgi:hypothetical protein
VEVNVPFCAFNGGSDVFVDAGNKSLGLQSLMSYLEVKPREVSVASRLLDLSDRVQNPYSNSFFRPFMWAIASL